MAQTTNYLSSGITNPQFGGPGFDLKLSPFTQLQQYHQDRAMSKQMYGSQMKMQNLDYAREQAKFDEWEAAGGVSGGTEPNPSEFPLCDPDVLYDPNLCNIFWEDIDDRVSFRGNVKETLTSRNVLVSISWDGTLYNHSFRDPGFSPPCPVLTVN